MTAEVKFVDHGLVDLWRRLGELGELELTIGFQGDSGAAIHPLAKVPVATVALYNEFGTIDAPARNFLRATMFERREEIVALYAREAGRVAMGKAQPVEALSRVGEAIAEMVREKIAAADQWATPNAPSTIAKKGHAQPLLGGSLADGVTGGTLRRSVSWAVRRGGAIVASSESAGAMAA